MARRSSAVARIRRGAAYLAEQDRAHYAVCFSADGGPEERKYLYQESGSNTQAGYREFGGQGFVIYRLPVSPQLLQYTAVVWAQGDYLVSIAPGAASGPGRFRQCAAARDRYPEDVLLRNANMERLSAAMDPDIINRGYCYLKIADGAPDTTARVVIRDVSLVKP